MPPEGVPAPVRAAPERALRVLLADERRDALDELSRVVESLGHEVTPYAISVRDAAELIVREEPDIACVMVHDDDEHALALISEVAETGGAPVIAVVREESESFLARAVEHGITACIHSPSPPLVEAAFELALRTHRETAELSAKVAQLENALARRSMIERAKGILMERHSLDEHGAFALLREHARARRVTVLELAIAVADDGFALPANPGG